MGRYDQNAKVYAKWLKEGRGQGQKQNYKPWLYVYNVPSRGRSHRIWSYTSNRVVHCLSDLELSVFLLLEWSSVVEDIREQFPLDLQTTLSIARDLEFRHPMLRGEKIVMTTDFLALTPSKSEPYAALQVKPDSELNDPRVKEKLAIEKAYWNSLNIHFETVSESSIDYVKVTNIKWLLPYTQCLMPQKAIAEAVVFWQQVTREYPDEKLLDLTNVVDDMRNDVSGTGLGEIRDLLACRAASFDMSKPYIKLCASDICFPQSLAIIDWSIL
jgi:hypothetical protein